MTRNLEILLKNLPNRHLSETFQIHVPACGVKVDFLSKCHGLLRLANESLCVEIRTLFHDLGVGVGCRDRLKIALTVPNGTPVLFAILLRKQGPQNYSQALEHYNKAIQLKPNLAEAYEYRGVLFLKMGRKVEAEKDLATLKTLNPKLATELEHVIQTGNEE
jgi:tetratricopeptide (TPR) repeat protein